MSNLLEAPPTVIFVDADNTLWDTDAVFAAAQLALLDAAERKVGISIPPGTDRLKFVRELDQGLAERHHAGLRYPPRLLVKALALTLKGVGPNNAIRLAWSGGSEAAAGGITDEAAKQIEGEFIAALAQAPELRPGVRTGLKRLREDGHLVLVLTEGRREKVFHTAAVHGLEGLFDRVIEARKDSRLFDRVVKLTKPETASFMVGDQLERDMRPAKVAGITTIFFPGGFRPRWEPAETEIQPDYTITTFDQVPLIVETVTKSHT